MTSFATHSKKNNVESSHQSIMTVVPDARMLFRMFPCIIARHPMAILCSIICAFRLFSWTAVMNVIQANQHLLRLIDHDYKLILYGLGRFVNWINCKFVSIPILKNTKFSSLILLCTMNYYSLLSILKKQLRNFVEYDTIRHVGINNIWCFPKLLGYINYISKHMIIEYNYRLP